MWGQRPRSNLCQFFGYQFLFRAANFLVVLLLLLFLVLQLFFLLCVLLLLLHLGLLLGSALFVTQLLQILVR